MLWESVLIKNIAHFRQKKMGFLASQYVGGGYAITHVSVLIGMVQSQSHFQHSLDKMIKRIFLFFYFLNDLEHVANTNAPLNLAPHYS